MRRFLPYTVRTTTTWLPLAVSTTAIAVTLSSSQETWAGDWWWGYNKLATTIPILLLALAFSSGWDSGSQASGVLAVRSAGPVNRALPMVGRLLATWLPSALTYLIAVGCVAVITAQHAGEIDQAIAIVAVSHLLMLMLASSIGINFGRYLTAPFAALASGACVAVLAFFAAAPGQQVFGINGGGSVVGYSPSVSYFAWSIVVLSALNAILLFNPLAVLRRLGSTAPPLTGLACLGIVYASAVHGPSDIFVDSGKDASRCTSSAVEVCVYPGYDSLGQTVAIRVEQLLKDATDNGIAADHFPSKITQHDGAGVTPAGVGSVVFPTNALQTGEVSYLALADSLSAPTWCTALYGDLAPVRMLDNRQAVMDWLLWVSGRTNAQYFRELHPEIDVPATTPRALAGTITRALRELRSCVT